ncbi:hypothetical protein [Paenibacillus borealis]|uniref:Flavoprotein domain-containing protein n=1 Tax=Paenibacillus borealis TaxID=160799 RepID=A0A089MX20_PAEBO|nr:hypothetical protein [Paenibacillus borealis]AIQ60914.1 hypothetical protein PBOR_31290 [Paenibacillus borealis]
MDSRHSTVAENALLGLSYRSRSAALNEAYPRVLVLLAGHFIGMEEGYAAVRGLSTGNFRLRLWAEDHLLSTRSAGELARCTGVDDLIPPGQVHKLSPADADALLIPVLSLSLLSRLVQLDTGHPFVRLIVENLCAGKPVGALTLGAEPEHYRWSEQGLSQASPLLKENMRSMVATLSGYGIKLLSPADPGSWLSSSAVPPRKQVLTEEDILEAVKLARTSITLNGPAVITPLARDTARQYGIEIIHAGFE